LHFLVPQIQNKPDMNSFFNRPVLTMLMIWNAIRAVWMSYAVFWGLEMLASGRGLQPYLGIGVDRQLLFRVGAMPLELTSIIAGFGFGRPGQVVLQIVAVAAYCLAAIGILALRERDEISCDCSRNSGIAPAGVVSQLRNTFRDATGISPLCDYLVVRFSLRVRPNVGLFAATR
jgi:hypothetical protein